MKNFLTSASAAVALLTTGGGWVGAAAQALGTPSAPARPWHASELLVMALAVLALAVVAAAGVLVYRRRQARRWEEAWYELADPADRPPEDGEPAAGEGQPRSGAASADDAAPQPEPRGGCEKDATALDATAASGRVPPSRY